MAEYGLGKAKGEVEIDATGVKKGLDDAKSSVNQFDSDLQKHGSTLQSTGAAMTGIGVAGVAAFGLIVKTAADFESQLNGIKAVSGATEQEMDKVRQTALRIGADTKYSASEAAGALEELVKAGISVNDAVNGAADATVNLAAAGGIELPEAATIAANAMNNFGLSAQDMPKIADLISGAANASAIDVSEFGFSLQQAGAVANLAGLSFDDLAVAVAAMGQAGIKGSDAGTSLKTFLQNLQPTTKKQTALFKELGLMTKDGANQFYDAAGNVKSFAEISETLQNALAGQTSQQKQMTLETLFGSDAIRAAAVAADNGAEGINGMAEAMGKVSAADTAKTRMEGLNGTIEQLKGTLETLSIQLGTPFLEAVNGMVQSFAGMVNAFSSLSPETQKLIVQIVLGAAALIGMAGAFTFAVGSVMKLISAIRAFSAAMKFIAAMKFVAPILNGIRVAMVGLNAALFANPIGLIVLAIIALVAAFVILYKKNETFRNAVNNLFADFKRGIAVIGEFLSHLGKSLVDGFNSAKDSVTNFVSAVVTFFTELPGKVSTAITNFINSVVEFLTSLPGRAATALSNFVATVVSFFQALPERIAYWLGFMIGAYIRFWINLITTAIEFGTNLVTTIVNFFQELPGRIWNFLVAAFNFMVQFATDMWNKAIETGTNVLNAIVEFFTQLPGRIQDFLTMAIITMIAWGVNAYNEARSTGERFLNAIIEFFSQLPGRVADFVSQTLTRIVNFASDMANKARETGQSFYNGIVDGIQGIPGAVSGIVDRMIDAVKGAATRAFNAVKDLAGSMWDGFKDGLGIHSPSFIEEAMFSMVDNVGGSIADLRKQVKTVQGLGSSLPVPGSELGATSSSAGLRAVSGSVATAPGTVVHEGDTFNLEAVTDASSEDIVSEFMWKKRVRAS